jgi:hypothetical protein
MKTRTLSALCLGLASALHPAAFPCTAAAQVSPTANLAQTAPAPGTHWHDGFYLRLGTGFGSYSEGIRQSGEDKQSTVSGIASVSEFAIGGAVRPGLILGGGVWGSTVLASDSTIRGNAPPGEVIEGRGDFSLVGPFFDYYRNPGGGLHIQGAIGLANVRGLNVDAANFDKDAISIGGGLMFGVGYDWWVSEQWSIGVLGRLAVGVTGQEDKSGVRWYHTVGGSPSILFVGTYN